MRRFLASFVVAGALAALFCGPQLALAGASYSSGGGGVAIQATTPGVAQVGNINVHGTAWLGTNLAGTGDGVAIGPAREISLGGQLLGKSVCGGVGSCITGGQMYFVAQNSRIVFDTGGFTLSGPNELFRINNNGAQRFLFGNDGTLTTAVPIPQSSGGTGTGPLTCPTGQFVTSNGTVQSCATPGAAFVVSATVSTAPAIIQQAPSTVALSVTNPSTGHYTVTVPGMTVSSIIVGSALESAGTGMTFSSTPATGQFTVSIVNGANAPVNNRFSFIVVAL